MLVLTTVSHESPPLGSLWPSGSVLSVAGFDSTTLYMCAGRSSKGGGGVFQNCSFAKRPHVAHMFHHDWWRLAVGGWWQLVAVGGGWWLVIGGWWVLVVGGWRLAAVGSGWRLPVGGGWWLVAVGGWRLAVPKGGP